MSLWARLHIREMIVLGDQSRWSVAGLYRFSATKLDFGNGIRGGGMNVFDTHAKIVGDYASYIRSFINIADPAIRRKVDEALAEGKLWPEPLYSSTLPMNWLGVSLKLPRLACSTAPFPISSKAIRYTATSSRRSGLALLVRTSS